MALAGCASYDGRSLRPGQSTAADVERLMGAPAERRQVGGETWLYYPRQPGGKVTFVARTGADGRLIGLEQRLTDQNVAKIVPNATRAEQVRDLLGPPFTATRYAGLGRDVWTWEMRHFGDPGVPGRLVVQMSDDRVVREVLFLQHGTGWGAGGS